MDEGKFSVESLREINVPSLVERVGHTELSAEQRRILKIILLEGCRVGEFARGRVDDNAPTFAKMSELDYERNTEVVVGQYFPGRGDERTLAFDIAYACFREAYRTTSQTPETIDPLRRLFNDISLY